MAKRALAPEKLRPQVSSDAIGIETSRDAPAEDGDLGQPAAAEALEFAIESPGQNQHAFVCGIRGSGRHRLVRRLIERFNPPSRRAQDYCFVHNFANPDRPRLIILDGGEGRSFQKHMLRIALFIKEKLPEILENDPIRSRRDSRREAAEREIRQLIRPLEKKLDHEGLGLIRTQAGPNARLQISIKIMGKPVSQEEFRNMVARKQANEEDRRRINEKIERFDPELQRVARQVRQTWQQAQQHIEQITIAETARILGDMTRDVTERFKAPGVETFLRELIDDVLEKRVGHDTSHLADPTVLYGVNVMHEAPAGRHAAVVSPSFVSAANLFGTVDPAWRSGNRAVASFHGIRAGAIVRADGGFLLLDGEDLLADPAVIEQLLRVMRNGSIEIVAPTPDRAYAAQSLKPEAIAVDVRVIIVGERDTLDRLKAISGEFNEQFRVVATVDATLECNDRNIGLTCAAIGRVVQRESLHHLDGGAMAEMIEHSARLADATGRLSARWNRLAQVIREASFVADRNREERITREHIDRAVSRIRKRRLRLDSPARGAAFTDTSRVERRVNSVLFADGDDDALPRPVSLGVAIAPSAQPAVTLQTSATERMDDSGLQTIIARLLHLDGPSKMEALVTLDGAGNGNDLAACELARACAIVCALAGHSPGRERAVIGALDTTAGVCAVSGINDRIESFFELCLQRRLNGNHGVIIPAANINRLAVDRAIVQACSNGQFHVHAVDHLGQALELLTGQTAGIWDQGAFTPDSIYARARQTMLSAR